MGKSGVAYVDTLRRGKRGVGKPDLTSKGMKWEGKKPYEPPMRALEERASRLKS